MTSRPKPDRTLIFDLSGVGLVLVGVPRETAARLSADWQEFRSDDAAPFLTLDVSVGDRSPADAPFRPKEMRSRLEVDRARFWMPEGTAEVDRHGRAQVELARDLGTREYFTLMNLLRACLAWRLPDRGAAMLHAAGLVVANRRAFLLVGSEDAGKSTWARLGESVGAHVVSDDLVLVDPERDGFVLLGAPFRSTHRTRFLRGRWPLAAILFARQGATHAVAPTARWIAKAKLTANMTFVAEAPAADGRIPRVVETLVEEVPFAELTFALDAGFVDLLDSWSEGLDTAP